MAKRTTKAGPLLALVLLFGPAFLLILISTRRCEHKFKVLEDYGPIPAYTFTDIKGKKYTNASFKNQIVIFTTLQPSCPDSCAVSTWHIDQQIFQQLRKNNKKLGHVKLVSFVTDGKGNPSDKLNEVAFTLKDQVEGYDPEIWILANGNARDAFNVTNNGKSLLQKGSQYYGGEAFQELMLLVDKSNHLRMVLSGRTESMVRTMKQHVALLDKQYDKEKWNKKHKK